MFLAADALVQTTNITGTNRPEIPTGPTIFVVLENGATRQISPGNNFAPNSILAQLQDDIGRLNDGASHNVFITYGVVR